MRSDSLTKEAPIGFAVFLVGAIVRSRVWAPTRESGRRHGQSKGETMSLEITDFFDLRIGPGEAPGPYRVEVVSSSTKPAVTNMELPQGLDESLAAVRMHAPDLGAFQELGSKLYHAL